MNFEEMLARKHSYVIHMAEEVKAEAQRNLSREQFDYARLKNLTSHGAYHKADEIWMERWEAAWRTGAPVVEGAFTDDSMMEQRRRIEEKALADEEWEGNSRTRLLKTDLQGKMERLQYLEKSLRAEKERSQSAKQEIESSKKRNLDLSKSLKDIRVKLRDAEDSLRSHTHPAEPTPSISRSITSQITPKPSKPSSRLLLSATSSFVDPSATIMPVPLPFAASSTSNSSLSNIAIPLIERPLSPAPEVATKRRRIRSSDEMNAVAERSDPVVAQYIADDWDGDLVDVFRNVPLMQKRCSEKELDAYAQRLFETSLGG